MAKTKVREKKDRYGKKYLWFVASKGSVNKCKGWKLGVYTNHIIYVQPNAASFFRKQVCACPTTRKARLVRTRRKKDAERGESAKQTCTSGSPFFCFLFFGEAKKRKCPVGTRRMVKTTLQADHTAVTLFQAAFGGRGKVCKRRAQRGCTAYGCGCHQLCGEVNSKCRRAADAPFLVFRLPLVEVASL